MESGYARNALDLGVTTYAGFIRLTLGAIVCVSMHSGQPLHAGFNRIDGKESYEDPGH